MELLKIESIQNLITNNLTWYLLGINHISCAVFNKFVVLVYKKFNLFQKLSLLLFKEIYESLMLLTIVYLSDQIIKVI